MSGRTVVFAPARARRPGIEKPKLEPPSQDELDECPFCEGREGRTPPETFAIAPTDRKPDTPGWQVRVVPNLYPALERQEVVVHTPRHVRSFAELEDEELSAVASTWHARYEAALAEGFAHLHLVLNEGRGAGASLPHSHSQLFWLRERPPAVLEELPNLEQGTCALCRVLDRPDLEIALSGDLALLSAPAGRMPYELLIAPRSHRPNPSQDDLHTAAQLLRDALRRLHDAEGAIPLNAWLHPCSHWHFEILPRLSVPAGLELGAEIYVNWLPPEEAAERLRS
jgi:UDPglucose--hexose-1-phosphate uridylyltransferase